MSAYAIVGLTYLNTKGAKKKVRAGQVFDDYQEDEFEDWEERGWARKATTGEKAEAAEQTEAANDKPASKRAKAPKKAATAESNDLA